jgi:hypothetical protein
MADGGRPMGTQGDPRALGFYFRRGGMTRGESGAEGMRRMARERARRDVIFETSSPEMGASSTGPLLGQRAFSNIAKYGDVIEFQPFDIRMGTIKTFPAERIRR